MNWAYRIVLTFILFAALIGTLVTISMRQEVNLVSDDYYKQEIAYQDQIDRIRRTEELTDPPRILLNPVKGEITIDLMTRKPATGQAWFFRPSDSRLDQRMDFSSDSSGAVKVNVAAWEKGRWVAKVQWIADGREYYMEKSITL